MSVESTTSSADDVIFVCQTNITSTESRKHEETEQTEPPVKVFKPNQSTVRISLTTPTIHSPRPQPVFLMPPVSTGVLSMPTGQTIARGTPPWGSPAASGNTVPLGVSNRIVLLPKVDPMEIKQMEEKRLQMLKEKEEEKMKKEMIRLEKEKERQAKREKKEREKQKKQEEITEKTRVHEKRKSHFMKYFFKSPPKPIQIKEKEIHKGELWYKPFFVKPMVLLAKRRRQSLASTEKNELEQSLEQTAGSGSPYLFQLKTRSSVPLLRELRGSNPKAQDLDDSVISVSSNEKAEHLAMTNLKLRPKFLQFHKTRRPAYFGTWRKRSEVIRPRAPLCKDTTLLDYDVDSDDEWEEEESGESIVDSEDDACEGAQGEEEEEEDDGFLVPHGYLSGDEGGESDGEASLGDPEKRKEMAKVKACQNELNSKFQSQKLIMIGCLWDGGDTSQLKIRGLSLDVLMEKLKACSLSPLISTPIPIKTSEVRRESMTPSDMIPRVSPLNPGVNNTARPVPDEAMPDLIRFLHGNSFGRKKLMDVFLVYWKQRPNVKQPLISRRQLEMKINAIAKKEVRLYTCKSTWYVHSSVIAQWGLSESDLPVPNTAVLAEVRRIAGPHLPSTPQTVKMSPVAREGAVASLNAPVTVS